MFGLQPQDLLIILIVALLLFGPKRLPEIGRAVGEALRGFRQATDEIKKPIEEAKQAIQTAADTAKEALTEPPLLVFVSSVMDPKREDLKPERAAAKRAIEGFPPLTRAWRFEDSPASPETAGYVYLKKVEQCDIFVLVLGKEITRPVIREYWRARKHKKPRLVFLKKCERTPAAQKFIDIIRGEVKYAEFTQANDLDRQIWQAVGALLIDGVRRYKLSANDVAVLTAFLTQLPKLESLIPSAELPAPAQPEPISPKPRIEVVEPTPPRPEPPSLFAPHIKRGRDGKRMILIPAGEFWRGTSDADILEMRVRFVWEPELFEDEKPQRKIYLDAYYIDETPVTNEEYKRFVDATGHRVPYGWNENWRTFPEGKGAHPVVNVNWDDANAYARWAGKRLPTEAEWEKAARGTDGRRYPWGNEFDSSRCNSWESGIHTTTPVGRYSPRGDSPYGVKDMAGNVWEWCADWYDENYYKNSPKENPKGPASGRYRVLRGGSWNFGSNDVRAASRNYYDPDDRATLWVFGAPSNFPQILDFCFLNSDGGGWGAQFAPQRKNF
jgi:TatA/E family protein of Tat protein translocase